jgi:Ca2+-binding EF-hand superfamily protein
MKAVFESLDTTGDNKVERTELQSAVLSMGIPLDESTGIAELTGSSLGVSGQSVLDFDGFYAIIAKNQSKGDRLTVDTIFKIFLTLDATWECSWKDSGAPKQREKKSGTGKWAQKGSLSWQDLKNLASDLGEQVDNDVLKEMVAMLDQDEDGVLGPDDFYSAINHASLAIQQSKGTSPGRGPSGGGGDSPEAGGRRQTAFGRQTLSGGRQSTLVRTMTGSSDGDGALRRSMSQHSSGANSGGRSPSPRP